MTEERDRETERERALSAAVPQCLYSLPSLGPSPRTAVRLPIAVVDGGKWMRGQGGNTPSSTILPPACARNRTQMDDGMNDRADGGGRVREIVVGGSIMVRCVGLLDVIALESIWKSYFRKAKHYENG